MKRLLFGALLMTGSLFAADWTVYVHMNGDNNLCPFTKPDMQEMQRSMNLENANVIVGYDCETQGDSALYQITRNGPVQLDLVPAGEWDMGNAPFMASVAKTVYAAFPSKYRMMVIWNHGSGVQGLHAMPDGQGWQLKNISYDDQSGNNISIGHLGAAMKDIGRVDVLGFDACLMQMIEVAYEVAPYTNFVVASEDLEPGEGWDYSVIDWNQNPLQLSVNLPIGYVNYYKPQGARAQVTMSTLDTRALTALVGAFSRKMPLFMAIKDWSKRFPKMPNWEYGSVDLGSVLQVVNDPELNDLYKRTVLMHQANQPSTGLGIMTKPFYSPQYPGLRFARESGWLKVISPAFYMRQ